MCFKTFCTKVRSESLTSGLRLVVYQDPPRALSLCPYGPKLVTISGHGLEFLRDRKLTDCGLGVMAGLGLEVWEDCIKEVARV